jgi:hypothetical protein
MGARLSIDGKQFSTQRLSVTMSSREIKPCHTRMTFGALLVLCHT